MLTQNTLETLKHLKLHGMAQTLQEQRETLNSQKDKLQAGISDTEQQLKSRAEFLQEKETKLAAEESRLENLGQQSQSQTQQSQSQAAVVKKFNDAVRKLSKDDDTDVVVRGGRPVLRVPNSVFFALGDATLKPEGKALLNQVAQTLNGQLDNFELRVESYTDDGEIQNSDDAATKTDTTAKSAGTAKDAAKNASPVPKLHYATAWELTSARAAAIGHFFRDQTSLPFQNVLVIGRSDFNPIVPATKDSHARNRRLEITVTPVPVPFHGADQKTVSGKSAGAPSPSPTSTPAPVNPLEPPPDPPAGANKKN